MPIQLSTVQILSITVPSGANRIAIINYTIGIDLTGGPANFGASYYTGMIYQNNTPSESLTIQEPPNSGEGSSSGLTYSITIFRILGAGTYNFDFRISRTVGNGVANNANMTASVISNIGSALMLN